MNFELNSTIGRRSQAKPAVQKRNVSNVTQSGSLAQRGHVTQRPAVISTRNWLEEQQQKFQRPGGGGSSSTSSAPPPMTSSHGRTKSNSSDGDSVCNYDNAFIQSDFLQRLQTAIINSSRVVSLPNTKQGFGLNVAVFDRGGIKLPYIPCVIDNSVAHQAGLRSGDFIIEVNGNDVTGEKTQWCGHWLANCGDILTLKVITLSVNSDTASMQQRPPAASLVSTQNSNNFFAKQPETAVITKKTMVGTTSTAAAAARHESTSSSTAGSVDGGSVTTISSFGTTSEEEDDDDEDWDEFDDVVTEPVVGLGIVSIPETPTSDYSSAPEVSSSDDSVVAILPTVVRKIPMTTSEFARPTAALTSMTSSQVESTSSSKSASISELRAALNLNFSSAAGGIAAEKKPEINSRPAKPLVNANKPSPTASVSSTTFLGKQNADAVRDEEMAVLAEDRKVKMREKKSSDDSMDFLRQAEKLRQEFVRKSMGSIPMMADLGQQQVANDVNTKSRQSAVECTDTSIHHRLVASTSLSHSKPTAPFPLTRQKTLDEDQPTPVTVSNPINSVPTLRPLPANKRLQPDTFQAPPTTMLSNELQQKMLAMKTRQNSVPAIGLSSVPQPQLATARSTGPPVSSKPSVPPKTVAKPSRPASSAPINELRPSRNNSDKPLTSAQSDDDGFILPPPPLYDNLPPALPDFQSSPDVGSSLLPGLVPLPPNSPFSDDVSRTNAQRHKPTPPLRRETSVSAPPLQPSFLNASAKPVPDGADLDFDGFQDLPPPIFDFQTPTDAVAGGAVQSLSGTISQSNSNNARMTSSVSSWDVNDVGNWLDQLALGEHRLSFHRHGIDGKQLMNLGRSKMIEIGVADVQHRMTIERQLRKLLNDV